MKKGGGPPTTPVGELLERRLRELERNKRRLDALAHVLDQKSAGETVIYEPATCETLDLQLAYTHGHNQEEYVRIGVPDEGFISLVIIHFDAHWRVDTLQSVLSIAEADAVIEGLQKAKRRLQSEKADSSA